MDEAGGVEHQDRVEPEGSGPIVIGFVNNMPDAALRTTERQFRDLLLSGPFGDRVSIRWFFMPDVPRADIIQPYLRQHYECIDNLWAADVDGLIVTGAEPRTPSLKEEPYWNTLARLIDWAEDNTVSTIWSCLAAHAAVLHIDGINRLSLNEKLSGVFDCQKVADHPLVSGMPGTWRIPHSRYNGLPAKSLEEVGYQILSISEDAGADLFIKQRSSLFIFAQGHPEYDPDALFREYRRDITRFLSGDRADFPSAPRFYFDHETATALEAFRRRALGKRTMDMLVELPVGIAEVMLTHPWREPARGLYANWVGYLAAQKLRYGETAGASLQHLPAAQLSGSLPGDPGHHHHDFARGL